MGTRAEMSGGRLHVRSVPGHGTIIEFWIPIPSSDLSAVTAPTDLLPATALVKREARATTVAVSLMHSDAFQAGSPTVE